MFASSGYILLCIANYDRSKKTCQLYSSRSLFFHAVEKAVMVWMKCKLKDLGVSHSTVFVHLSLWVKALCWLSGEGPGYLSSPFLAKYQPICQFHTVSDNRVMLSLGPLGRALMKTQGSARLKCSHSPSPPPKWFIGDNTNPTNSYWTNSLCRI